MNGLTGTCSLAFQHGAVKAGPVAAEPGSAIPSVVGTPASTNPVSVQVLDGNGNPISALDVPITITADQNSSPVTVLSGTTSGETNGQGTASFDDLIISQTGSFYQLVATTTPGLGIAAGTSSDFEILNDLQGCTGAPCSGSASTTTTSGAATTSSATSGQFLGVGIGGATFACGGSYQPVSDPLTFDVLNSSGAISNATVTVMLTISKQLVQSSGHPGASSWQICFGSDVPFTAQPGTAETYTVGSDSYFYTGLLPDCNKNQTNAPCVVSRHKGNAGVEEVTFVGYGDMNGRA